MIRALLFDVFGTVVNWRDGVAREVDEFFASQGIEVDAAAFADAWRAKYDPAMARIRSGDRGYVPLDSLHRENLDATLAEFGMEVVGSKDRDYLNHAWEKLPPWPDSVPGLTKLKAKFTIAACSNGSLPLMRTLADFAGLPWDRILGAGIAKDYKPSGIVYLASVSALGRRPDQVMMVAAHNNDLEAARAQGLKTAFVPRPGEHGPDQEKDLSPSSDWDVVAADLEDLATKLQSFSGA